jgi:thiamine pyrophosphate-dependent acetolactate synthase large subunit-like protein
MNGGDLVAEVLRAQGVEYLFTLCGGHISPILVSSKARGIAIIDVRDEASAVFAADAVARMTGVPGVAAVTAGPGLTNTLTAVENAKLAQTPLIILGGATATILKGRGALQDIDQMALMRPAVKHAIAVDRVRKIGPAMEEAFRVALDGVPGPVFVELPVDLLYEEETVRSWYVKEAGGGKSLFGRAKTAYVESYVYRVFRDKDRFVAAGRFTPDPMEPAPHKVRRAAELLKGARKPVLVVGAQTITRSHEAHEVAEAIQAMGVPTFLGGTARGLLGTGCPTQFRHARGKALKDADVVLVTGFPFDFRMSYGWKINPKARIVQVDRDESVLGKNRRPELAIEADGGRFLLALRRAMFGHDAAAWEPWIAACRSREEKRDAEIATMSDEVTEHVNPMAFFRALEPRMADDSVLVVDGGDFVATGAYMLRPRRPLSWLDPGVFGTLGVGGGFAVGAACVRRGAEIWLIYGDGASAYSIAEFDTLARHGLPVIAVIGNDASWAQIARDQITILGDDVGTVLARTAYHKVAEAYGGVGIEVKTPEEIVPAIERAKKESAEGRPVCINVWIGKTAFREGSISI